MARDRHALTAEQSNTDLHYDKAFQPHYFKQAKMLPGISLTQFGSKEHNSGLCQEFSRRTVVFQLGKQQNYPVVLNS